MGTVNLGKDSCMPSSEKERRDAELAAAREHSRQITKWLLEARKEFEAAEAATQQQPSKPREAA